MNLGDDVVLATHFEVLVRMQDEAGKMVSPRELLPAVERYGLMVQIDRWVLRRGVGACAGGSATGAGTNLDTVSIRVNSEMADAIQRIASRLDMQTVAECVEREEEKEHLRTLGVHFVQGYLLARPAPLDAVLGLQDTRRELVASA